MASANEPEMSKEFEDVYDYFDKQTNDEDKDESGNDESAGLKIADEPVVPIASDNQTSMYATELKWAEQLLRDEDDGTSLKSLAPELQKVFENLKLNELEGKQITDMLSSNDELNLKTFLDSLDADDNCPDVDDCGEDAILDSLKTLMHKVLGKETLYPVLKSTTEVYPDWLQKNRTKYSADEMAAYEQQHRKLLEVCAEFENFDENSALECDKNAHSERIYMLMEDVRKLGDPPKDLLTPNGDIGKACTIM